MDINRALNILEGCIPQEQILFKEPMANHTSFRIGGPADALVMPTEAEHIICTLKVCRDLALPLFIMGNGSNLLVRDKGIRGLVLKLSSNYSQISITNSTIKAQSGALMSVVSQRAANQSLKGLEFANGIPGTLGGAVVMNAGAYGGEMKDVVVWIKGLDREGRYHTLTKNDLNFGYRRSTLQDSDIIVLEVGMELEKGDKKESIELMTQLNKKRREKQPLSHPSAGSTFKRPVGYYAGKLIQDCGLRGLRVGDAQISERHAGFIINLGNAKAEDVISLIQKVQNVILEKYGVKMKPEVKIVGEI